MKIYSKIYPLVFLPLFLTLPFAAFAQKTILGVLEENTGIHAGESNSYGVRICFRNENNEWKAYPNDCENDECLIRVPAQYPHLVNWTIAFDGRSLSQLTGETPAEFLFYSRIGLQKIISTGAVPMIGKSSMEFSGFAGQPVHRPLVAISHPFFRDPDLWKPVQVTLDDLSILRQEFRKKYPKLCRINEDKMETNPYRDEDIQIAKAYKSRQGWIIACLHVDAAIDCDDTKAGFDLFVLDEPWFTVDPRHSAHYLDHGMWLVDAGDYDNDGKSELLFSISRYNRGGYLIYYDQFKKHVTFEYSYH